jgi:hypothetical protein
MGFESGDRGIETICQQAEFLDHWASRIDCRKTHGLDAVRIVDLIEMQERPQAGDVSAAVLRCRAAGLEAVEHGHRGANAMRSAEKAGGVQECLPVVAGEDPQGIEAVGRCERRCLVVEHVGGSFIGGTVAGGGGVKRSTLAW